MVTVGYPALAALLLEYSKEPASVE